MPLRSGAWGHRRTVLRGLQSYPVSVYFCLVGPKDMDPAVTQYISDVVEETLQDATVQEAFENLDQPIVFTGAEEFATRAIEDRDMYNALLKDMGVIK